MLEPESRAGDTPSPFDRTLARFPTRLVRVDHVVDLLSLTHAPERIEIYRDAMRRGSRFPPISVIRLVGRLVVADGHKRLAAARQTGAHMIDVEIWPWWRFLADQCDQAVRNVHKNRLILQSLFVDPAASRRLAASTVSHWRRVASSIALRLTRR